MKNLKDRVTIYQVAQAAGVSLATVSRVINKSGNVTESTRRKVEDTIATLGYKPSALAQALATNRTTNIGVIIPSANYVYIANFLNGLTQVAKEKGYVLTLFSTSHSRDEAMSMIEKVITTHVDGAIIFDDQLGQEDVNRIASYSVPSVVIDARITGDKVGEILLDYDSTVRSLVESYYARGGKKEMTFLHVHNGGRLLDRCERAFISAHDKVGHAYKVVNCDDSYARTYADFVQYFKNVKSGFFLCYRDSIAAAVMNAATDSGLKVPEDIEIVSIVGTKYAAIVRPTLSSFHIDMSEVGKRAMYMLTDLLNQNLVDKTYRFESSFAPGSSTIAK